MSGYQKHADLIEQVDDGVRLLPGLRSRRIEDDSHYQHTSIALQPSKAVATAVS